MAHQQNSPGNARRRLLPMHWRRHTELIMTTQKFFKIGFRPPAERLYAGPLAIHAHPNYSNGNEGAAVSAIWTTLTSRSTKHPIDRKLSLTSVDPVTGNTKMWPNPTDTRFAPTTPHEQWICGHIQRQVFAPTQITLRHPLAFHLDSFDYKACPEKKLPRE